MLVCLVGANATSEAGQEAGPADAARHAPIAAAAPAYSPPAPVEPEVISRDAAGHATILATRLSQPLDVDGRLNEAIYGRVPAISDFIQTEPSLGAPGTEKTEMWVFFDDTNLYVCARLWESHPERMVAREMRRDHINVFKSEVFSFMLDTFLDRRSSLVFHISALGAVMDGQSIDAGPLNTDWNPVWNPSVGRFDGGWTVEAVLPFKSLRFRPGRDQVWGFNARRGNLWKNEVSYLVSIPPMHVENGLSYAKYSGTLVGLQVAGGSTRLELKPYATADLTSDMRSSPRVSNDLGRDAGLDIKYGLTQGLTADVTLNSDFAQVEADEQQINLTRFNLFFPERREFFLENRGIFDFGSGRRYLRGEEMQPIMFYSRRIGLQNGRLVPLEAGGRVTGKTGRFTLGVLNAQTGEAVTARAPATNFTVVRVKRDILRSSTLGLIATRRSVGLSGVGSNETYGADGYFKFFDSVSMNAYWAKTQTPGKNQSYRGTFEFNADRYGVMLERLAVDENFRPEVGFVPRADIRRSYAGARFSPRPHRIKAVRKFSWTASLDHIENGAGALESREREAEFAIEFQNGDRFSAGYRNNYELLETPLTIDPGVRISPGSYTFDTVVTGYSLGQQHRFFGGVAFERGTFYSGERTMLALRSGRFAITPKFSVEPTLSVNWLTLDQGSFAVRLLGSRITYTVTPRMFFSALLQGSSASHIVSTNARFRWEYQPGSELFLVFNDERDTHTRWFPDMANRSVIVKVNRLLRF